MGLYPHWNSRDPKHDKVPVHKAKVHEDMVCVHAKVQADELEWTAQSLDLHPTAASGIN